jgi:hypothetical protein
MPKKKKAKVQDWPTEHYVDKHDRKHWHLNFDKNGKIKWGDGAGLLMMSRETNMLHLRRCGMMDEDGNFNTDLFDKEYLAQMKKDWQLFKKKSKEHRKWIHSIAGLEFTGP